MPAIILLQIALQYVALFYFDGLVNEIRHQWSWWWLIALGLSVGLGVAADARAWRLRHSVQWYSLSGIVWFLVGVLILGPMVIAFLLLEAPSGNAVDWVVRFSFLGESRSAQVSPVLLRAPEFCWGLLAIGGHGVWLGLKRRQLGLLLLYSLLGFLIGCAAITVLDLSGIEQWRIRVGPLAMLPVLSALLLSLCVGCQQNKNTFPAGPPHRRLGIFLAVSLTLLLLSSISWKGSKRAGDVMIDEYHSEWSWINAPFDQLSYGNMTTYNYVAFAEFIRSQWSTTIIDKTLTPEQLHDCSVLIIKMPTKPYLADEIDALVEFVAEGGGLLLIGDHTNVFGTSRVLNEVSERFGITYNFDAVNDAFPDERQVLTTGPGRAHPSSVSTGPTLMATSCSLGVSWPAMPLQIGRSVFADEGDYQKTSFFGNSDWEAPERGGSLIQAASAQYGRGRVIALADSTIFSTFTFYFPGIWDQLAQSLVYLQCSSAGLPENVLFILRLSVLALSLALLMRQRPVVLALWSVLSLVALEAANAIHAASYSISQIKLNIDDVLFYKTDHYLLPLEHETHNWDTRSYHTFFVWMQRAGRIPRVATTYTETLKGRCAVFISMNEGLSRREEVQLLNYIRAGGTALFLVNAGRISPRLQETCRSLGFGEAILIEKPVEVSQVFGAVRGRIQTPAAVAFTAGEPLLTDESGRAIGAQVRIGRGSVAMLGIGRDYAVDRYGAPKEVPDPRQRALAQFQFDIMERLLGRAADVRTPK